MPKRKTTPKKPPKAAPAPRLYTRRSTAALLDTSVDTVKELERQGLLEPIRLTGPRGQVHYNADQVLGLAKGDADA